MKDKMDAQCAEKQPAMVQMIASLKNRIAGIEMTSQAIKTRVAYIDGNVPPIKDETKSVSPNCLYEELNSLLYRLSDVEDMLSDCNNRLTNQLG
jgi:hypothetical protein